MLLKSIVLLVLAFFSGIAVSAGTFAFILVIGVIPRMLRTANLMEKVIPVENVIVVGVIFGTVMSLWDGISFAKDGNVPMLLGIAGHALVLLYGIGAGIFVGCIAVALAEILNTFPILFQRFNLTKGLETLMFAMAFGKLAGALFSFLGGYHF